MKWVEWIENVDSKGGSWQEIHKTAHSGKVLDTRLSNRCKALENDAAKSRSSSWRPTLILWELASNGRQPGSDPDVAHNLTRNGSRSALKLDPIRRAWYIWTERDIDREPIRIKWSGNRIQRKLEARKKERKVRYEVALNATQVGRKQASIEAKMSSQI